MVPEGEDSYPFRSTHSSPPLLLRIRSSKALIVSASCVAVFVDGFIYGAFVPILPFLMKRDLKVPEDEVQYWSSLFYTAFGVGILVGSPIFGWVADRTSSRRPPFLFGIVTLAAGTVLLLLRINVYVVLASRFVQGLSYAVVFTVGLALLVDTVDHSEVGQFIGYFSSSSSAALLVSPMIGGVTYSKVGYYGVFAIVFALIGVDFSLRLLLIEKKNAQRWKWQAEQSSYGTFGNDQTQRPNGNHAIHRESASSIMTNSSTCTVPEDDRSDSASEERQVLLEVPTEATDRVSPMPLIATVLHSPFFILLKSPRLLAANYGIFVNCSLIACFDGVLPFFVQKTFGWNASGAGLIFLCLVVPSLTAPIVGILSDRYGPRWIAAGGLFLSVPPLVLLRLVTHNSMEQIVLLCVILTCIGFTLNLVLSPLTAELTCVVDASSREHPGIFRETGAYGQAFALFTFTLGLAITLGPPFAGYLRTHYGWSVMTTMLGIVSASGVIPVVIFTDGMITSKHSI